MANITQPRVQSTTSQAQTSSPIVVREQEGFFDQLIDAAPAMAQVAINAQKFGAQQRMNTQAAEDQTELGEVSSHINSLALGALRTQEQASTVEQLSLDLAQSNLDGDIGANDYRTMSKFNEEFAKLNTMRAQNPQTARQVEIRAREKLDAMSASNPHLATKLEQTFRAVMGGVSVSSGTQAQTDLVKLRDVQGIYGENPSPDQFQKWGRLEAQRRRLDAQKEELGIQAEQGNLHMGAIKNLVGGKFDNGMQRIQEEAQALWQRQGALKADQIDNLKFKARNLYNTTVNNSRGLINEVNAQGAGVIDRNSSNKFLQEELGGYIDSFDKWVDDADLGKKLTAMNTAQQNIMNVGAMNKVRNVQTIMGDNNTGGALGLSAVLAGKDPATRAAVEGLANATGDSATGIDFEETMINAFTFVNQQTVPPGYEKYATLAGILSMRNGETDPNVQTNTAQGLGDLNQRKGDVTKSIAYFSEPAIARTYAGADAAVTQDLQNTITNLNSSTLGRVRQDNLFVEYDQVTDKFVAFRGPTFSKPNPRQVRPVDNQFVTADVFETIQAAEFGGRGKKSSRFSNPLVDNDISKDINALYRLHNNPNYRALGGASAFKKEWLGLGLEFNNIQPEEQVSE